MVWQVSSSTVAIVAVFLLYAIPMNVAGFVEEEVYELSLVVRRDSTFLLIFLIQGLIGGIGFFVEQIRTRYLILVI